MRAMKKRPNESEDANDKKRSNRLTFNIQTCIFCEKGKEEDILHEFSTFDADKNVRTIATDLQDTELLSKISTGDLIAIEAKYHLKCLVALRNRYRTFVRRASQGHPNGEHGEEKMKESIALVELINHIEKSVDSGILLFRLSELHNLYISRLLDLEVRKVINKTRLKECLLDHFHEAQEQYEGKHIIIVFKEGMANILRDALKERDYSEDAITLAKAANIIRNDMFNHSGFKFNGSFSPNCQEDSLPTSLKSLVAMILKGPDLKDQDRHTSQPCLTIAQTILYNMKKRPSNLEVRARHRLSREPPLPIYLGLNIHAVSRNKKLIQMLYQMGISISYDRIMELEDWLATSVCERFEEDGVVSPANLRKGLFTVGALDNLDHNPSSTTAKTSFHGTGISLFQFPTKNNHGEVRPSVTVPPSGNRKLILPEMYTSVPAVALKTSTVGVPSCNNINNIIDLIIR
jgi:hypothetical protein